MPPDATRLAVLIDSDNTTASLTTELLEEIAKYGTPTIKRAYGDWTTQHLVGWKEELLRHAIQPVQQFAYTRGKNSTDSALIIDAMDLLYAGQPGGLRHRLERQRLHAAGDAVAGIGDDRVRARAPQHAAPFVAACDRFIYLDLLSQEPQEPARRAGRRGADAAAAQPQADPVDRDQQHVQGRRLVQPRRGRLVPESRATRRSTLATTATRSSASSSARSRTSR